MNLLAYRKMLPTLVIGGLCCMGVLQQAIAQAPTRVQSVALDRVLAIVNNEAITASDLSARVATVKRQLRRQTQDLPADDELRRQVLERLVTEKVLTQAARERGLLVDERQIDATISRVADQNKLSLTDFRARIERDGTSFARFREEVRDELVLDRLRERETETRVQVTESEVNAYLAANAGTENVEYNIQQILLKLPENNDAAAIERQKLRAEELIKQLQRGVDFNRLASTFSDAPDGISGGGMGWRAAEKLPQLFVTAVQNLRVGEIAALQRSQAGFHIIKLLDKRGAPIAGASGTPVQQTRARHILIRLNEVVTEADAVRRLRDIRARVLAGTADFAEMAKQHSSDGSAARGGDLGWVYPGDTVAEFERAMDALAPNAISEPVRSPFGFHLIQVQERRTQEASEDRQRQAARVAIRERKGAEAFDEFVRESRARAFVEMRLDEQ
jgi:peptidyl-prolyl cis-trans isomerase SurA